MPKNREKIASTITAIKPTKSKSMIDYHKLPQSKTKRRGEKAKGKMYPGWKTAIFKEDFIARVEKLREARDKRERKARQTATGAFIEELLTPLIDKLETEAS